MGNIGELIAGGKAILGIEFGSTRIKAVLIDEAHKPIAKWGPCLGEPSGKWFLDLP